MDTPAIKISLDGTKIKADDGEWLVHVITREKGLPADHARIHDRGGDARCAGEENQDCFAPTVALAVASTMGVSSSTSTKAT
jgi:hypothetical protein